MPSAVIPPVAVLLRRLYNPFTMFLKSSGDEVFSFRAMGRMSDIFSTVIGAFAWVAVIYLLYIKIGSETGNVGIPLPVAVGTGAVGVVVNAAALLRQLKGKEVVFDGASRTISISRLFGKPSLMTFQSVARVAPLTYKGIFAIREAYCLVPTIAPLFGFKIISPVCIPGGRKIERFKSEVLPKIEKILELDRTGETGKIETKLSAPSCYTAQDARYTKSFARRYLLLRALLVIIILCSLPAVTFLKIKPVAAAFLALSAALPFILLSLLTVTSVSFDTLKNVMELRRGIFGWGGVKTYELSRAVGFEVKRNGTALYGDGRGDVYLRLEGAPEPVLLMPSASRGKASADELKFLAGLLGLDPARDMAYTLYQLTSTMFEVP